MRYAIIGFILGVVGTYAWIIIFKPCLHIYKTMTYISLDKNGDHIVCVQRFCTKCMEQSWDRRLTPEETKLWKEDKLDDENIKKKAKNYKS